MLPYLEQTDVNLGFLVRLSMPNSKCQSRSNKLIVHKTHLFAKIDSESSLRLYLNRRSRPSFQRASLLCKDKIINETCQLTKHINNLEPLSRTKKGHSWQKLQLLRLAATKSIMFKKLYSKNCKWAEADHLIAIHSLSVILYRTIGLNHSIIGLRLQKLIPVVLSRLKETLQARP